MNDEPLDPAPELRLTTRECDVLALLATGCRQEQVATRLGIGTETVRTHIRNASARLGAANATQAVAIAIRCALIQV